MKSIQPQLMKLEIKLPNLKKLKSILTHIESEK